MEEEEEVGGSAIAILQYDPVPFFPSGLVAIGNLYSMVYYLDDDNHIVTDIKHDLTTSHAGDSQVSFIGTGVRNVAALDGEAFRCLHFFWLYQVCVCMKFKSIQFNNISASLILEIL